ncbi:hypothetical protein PMAYCL1PPCAC_10932, partial [Pristionchus mayeri]
TRLTTITWDDPEWSYQDEIVSVDSNFKSGDVFYWGDFHIVYTAQNTEGSVGRCEFDLFLAPNECSQPDYESDQGHVCVLTWTDTLASQVGSYLAASVTCNDTRFPMPDPQFYTCDVMGQWHRSVASPALTLPVCGATDNPLQTIRGFVVYNTKDNCTERHDTVLHAMESVLDEITVPCDDQQTPVKDECYVLTMTSCEELDFIEADDPFVTIDTDWMIFNFTIQIKYALFNLDQRISTALWNAVDKDNSLVDMLPTDFACDSNFPIKVREGDDQFCSQTSPGNFNDDGESKPCPIGTYS